MAFGEFCCPYCDSLDFEDEDDFFEHVCECQYDIPTETFFEVDENG